MPRAAPFVGIALMLAGAVAAQEVAPSAEEIRPLLIGSQVPDVMVRTAAGSFVGLRDAIGDTPAQFKLDTEGNSVSTEQVLPVPAVFVIGPDQLITFSYVNPNFRVRCDANVLLAAATAATKQP